MLAARRLREKIQRGDIVTGILVTDHLWPDLVEICHRAGMDYLIVDMEHGAGSTETVAEVCATGRRMNFPVLLRPRANDYTNLRISMDLGPCGFLLATVESAEELDRAREAIYLPPRGRRRPGGMGNRWVADLEGKTWRETVEDHFIVWPQIESQTGLVNADAIARHELTTSLAVGPYDLSADLGVCGQMDHPRLTEALAQLQAVAQAAGKAMWMIDSNVERMLTGGWRLLCVGESMWILEQALRERVERARGSSKDAAPRRAY